MHGRTKRALERGLKEGGRPGLGSDPEHVKGNMTTRRLLMPGLRYVVQPESSPVTGSPPSLKFTDTGSSALGAAGGVG